MGNKFKPDMVAGHSLGEFSAIVASHALSFENGLKLVFTRALAMQKACEQVPSTMAAILGLNDGAVEKVCKEIDEVVVPANYNSPGQIVISGSIQGIDIAIEKLLATGAKRALKLAVGGAFHSPLMEPARLELEKAIDQAEFNNGIMSDNIINEVKKLCEESKKLLIVNSQIFRRKAVHHKYAGASIISLNIKEAKELLPDFSLDKISNLSGVLNSNICLTLGSDGSVLYLNGKLYKPRSNDV